MTSTITIEILMEKEYKGIPKVSFEFKKELMNLIHKYYPNWKYISYHTQETKTDNCLEIQTNINELNKSKVHPK